MWHRVRRGLYVCIALALPGAATAQDATDLRVMSFNIRYGTASDGDNAWPHRRALVFDVIRDAEPDVLGIQESLAFQLEEIIDALPQYDLIGVGRDDGREAGEYAAILIDRNRFEVLEEGTFWFSNTPSEPGSTSWGNNITRICTWVRVRDRRSGHAFYMYNVHWDHESQQSRERSAQLLIEQIAARSAPDNPVIVTGDFNAGETNPAFQYLTTNDLSDTFRTVHPNASAVGTFNAFRGDTSGEKIDAILTSPRWTVIDAAIVRTNRDGRHPSDHFPVKAILRLIG